MTNGGCKIVAQTFKVGDRVRVVRFFDLEWPNQLVDLEGVVVNIDDDPIFPIIVRTDTCRGRFHPDELELITDDPR